MQKVQQFVILSETKNLGCDTVYSVLWPDPSAVPQDDRKTAFGGAKQQRNREKNLD